MSASAIGWPKPEQVLDMLRHVADQRLHDAVRSQPLPDGQWCVRRLDIAVELDPERPLSALETDWADRIVTALRLSLRDGSQDVVLYVRPEDAVDDLLKGLATARFEHAWAWNQVGLLEMGQPEPQSDPAAVCLRVLARLGHGRVAALTRMIGHVGAHPVHRLLGSAGWVQAAALVAAESGTTWAPTGGPATEPTSPDRSTAADRHSLDALSQAIVTTGLASALRGSDLRVTPDTLQAWAVLAISAADPTLLRTSALRSAALIAAVGEQLQPTAGAGLSSGPALRRSSSTATRGILPSHQHSADQSLTGAGDPRISGTGTQKFRPVDGDQDTSRSDSPADIASDGAISQWGGLLYLLNSSAASGLPELLEEPPFLSRPAPWVMHRLGLALVPVEPDDPALLAFAGIVAYERQTPPDDTEQESIERIARRWMAVTAKRLRHRHTEDTGLTSADLVHRAARRSAIIQHEPGWLEVRLRLDEVDLDVRRAGLDVDPGWVWWLGHVVRFRYE